jgi:5-formyltetrahydrofolate cyclo-ligase
VISEEKAQLRDELQNALRTFGTAARHQASTRIQQSLFRSDLWKKSQVILLFSALPGEPRTVEILKQGLAEGKICVYPKVDALKMDMRLFSVRSRERLVRGSFGILEPDVSHCEPVEFTDVELACIPGLGFDVAGNRIGRGYGYYDRFLSGENFQAVSIGCHFECQQVSAIPVEAHDRLVHYLLTEKGLRQCRKPGSKIPD